MNIHEYQAKELLKSYGIQVPQGICAITSTEAFEAAQSLGGDLWVVKAQIHAGGRGKAGGVILVKTPTEAKNAAEHLLGQSLVTHQTSPEGQIVRRLYIERGSSIAREFYLSLILDRTVSRIAIVGSAAGGVDIEEIATNEPHQILTQHIDPVVGISGFHARNLAHFLGLTNKGSIQLEKLLKALYQVFIEKDASLIEINPLVETKEGDLVTLDAKINFDDNGLYRHPDIMALRDLNEENPLEIKAGRYDLSYVKLNGSIGCMVNGAGLAMATMDIIKLYGIEPANFLDVGGGANQEKVAAAFKIILADPNVKAILINIFGGIMRCDIIAEGIIAAAKEVALTIPMVVRLQGTHADLGKAILAQSGLKIIAADDFEDAATKVVAAAKGNH